VVAKSVPKPRSPSKIASKPVQQRLLEALATVTDPSVLSPHRPTIATLCRLAGVSRKAVSMGRRNAGSKHIRWRHPLQGLSWPCIQLSGDGV
jgi:hypothetical protein